MNVKTMTVITKTTCILPDFVPSRGTHDKDVCYAQD